MAEPLTEAKLREWIERLGPRLIALSAGICRDRHQAEEVVQEAFVKLWNAPPDAGEIAFTSWLRRVVTNLSINALNRTKRPGPLPAFSADRALRASDRPQRASDAGEELDRVHDAMTRLDPAERSILMLRAYEGLSYEEIARHLGVPVGTVMSRLNRARAALIEEMKSGDEHAGDKPLVFPFRQHKLG